MKLRISILVLIITLTASCKQTPAGIPSGSWNYDLIVNGVKAGTASVSNEKAGDTYILKSEMALSVGSIENRSMQVIKETTDFKPLSLEMLNTVKDNSSGKTQVINKTATFNGNEVSLTSGDYKSTFKIEEPFILDGNYFFSELLKTSFKKGTKVKANIYEPTVELEDPILVVVEVMGYEKIDINGKTKKLMHIKHKVEKLKSLDVYINDNGITEKVVIKMLNNVFELVKVD